MQPAVAAMSLREVGLLVRAGPLDGMDPLTVTYDQEVVAADPRRPERARVEVVQSAGEQPASGHGGRRCLRRFASQAAMAWGRIGATAS